MLTNCKKPVGLHNRSIEFAREVNWPCKETSFHQVTAELELLAGADRSTAIDSAIASLRTGLETAPEPQATYRAFLWNLPTTRRGLEMMLADLYLEDGNAKAAEAVLKDAVAIRQDAMGPEHIQTSMAQLRLGEFLVDHATSEGSSASEAEQPLLATFEKLQSEPDVVHRLRWRVTNCLADMYQSIGQPQDAAKWREIAESYDLPEVTETEQ